MHSPNNISDRSRGAAGPQSSRHSRTSSISPDHGLHKKNTLMVEIQQRKERNEAN